jgi:hypothetical protein
MRDRIALHNLLISVLGSKNVYYQPPPTIKMNYPCIVYHLDYLKTSFSNNNPYAHMVRYKITVVDKNPDSLIKDAISNLQACAFNTSYTSDNLNHFVFNLYF